MRLFYAIELPADIKRQLGRLRSTDDNSRDYRWVEPASMHVTLAFLGEQPAEQLPLLQEIGATAASAGRVAILTTDGVGEFGSKRAPRVLVVNLAGDLEALSSLQSKVDAGLRQAGFPLEERPFRPHITLARRRESAQGGPPVGWPPRLEPLRFETDRLTLFQSRLSPRGPTYVPLSEFTIGRHA